MEDQFRSLSELARVMDGSRAIGFIGAGASKRSGYPLWHELLGNLRWVLEQETGGKAALRDLPTPKQVDDPRFLAEIYTDALKEKVDRDDAIDQALHRLQTKTEPSQLHRILARLPFRQFITTNYDELVEMACNAELTVDEDPCKTYSAVRDNGFNKFLKGFAGGTDRRSVLHLHGTEDGSMTLALSDYDEQYLGEGMLLRMFTIFATSTVVFVGTSLTDTDLMQMIRRAHWHGDRKTRHYAFMPLEPGKADDAATAAKAEMLARSYGIETIFYDVHNGSHLALDGVLSHLLELIESRAGREAPRPHANRMPVLPDSLDQPWERDVGLTELRVREEIRIPPGPRPVIAIPGLEPTESDLLLRRIALDYRRIPSRFGFSNVVWLSPKRIGLFSPPNGPVPRRVVDAVMGEITRALGEHKLTSTQDFALNQAQLGAVLERERTLFVVAGVDDLYRRACDLEDCDSQGGKRPCGRRLLGELFTRLPTGSVVVFGTKDQGLLRDASWRFTPVAPVGDRGGTVFDIKQRISALPEADEAIDRELLSAAAILATPVPVGELAARLHRSPIDLDSSVARLKQADLIETGPDESAGDGADGASVRLDVTSPVRAVLLDEVGDPESGLQGVFRDTTGQLLDWAHRTLNGLQHWHHDNSQYERMNRLLPDLLAIFEGACWLGMNRERTEELIEFGMELTEVLYLTGRWSEAVSYGEYLDDIARRYRSPQLIEIRLVRSRVLSLANLDRRELRQAASLARSAERNPRAKPTQRLRAEIRRIVAEMRLARAESGPEASDVYLEELERVWNRAWRNHTSNPSDRGLAAAAAEAADRLGEAIVEKAERVGGPQSRRTLLKLLRILDRRADLLKGLRSNRELGHNWRLRADALRLHGRTASARRYFARALLVSHEFRDRLLEARSRMGIGRCDRDAAQLFEAARGFRALSMEREEAAAAYLAESVRDEAGPPSDVPGAPTLVLVLGPSGSGRSTALEVTASYLGEADLDPLDRSEIIGAWPDDPHEMDEKVAELRHDAEDRRPPGVVISKVDQAEPIELYDTEGERKALARSLIVHLQPRVRSDHESVTQWLELGSVSTTDPPSRFETWDSALEYSDISYVAVDSNVPIIELEDEIRRVLSFSYLPVSELLEQNRTWTELDR